MNQFFMFNLQSLINTLFPPVVRNFFRQLYRNFLNAVCMAQLYIYFALDKVPFLCWMCPVLEHMDGFIRIVWGFIVYIVKLEVCFLWNIAKLYARALRCAICLFYGYSILFAVSNMEFATNIPMLEMILQNTEWLYQYAGQFVDFNVAILKKVVENFCAVPFEQKSYFEQEILDCVKQFVDSAKQFINS